MTIRICPECGGEGSHEIPHPQHDDPFFCMVEQCRHCGGVGRVEEDGPPDDEQAVEALVKRLRDAADNISPIDGISDGKGYPAPLLREAADALAALPLMGVQWQPIETAPKDEMFIWAAPKGEGKWSLGLAYRNVSGGWSDAYGSDAPARATRWCPLPEPPIVADKGTG